MSENPAWATLIRSIRDSRETEPGGFVLAIDIPFGQAVHIDGDTSLTGFVTGLMSRSSGTFELEVSWIHNGAPQSGWFAQHRLSLPAKEGK